WREAKISLAHAKGSRTPIYGGGIEGGAEAAGRQLLTCAVRAGFGTESRVHAVGDGAPWIVGQIEHQFGAWRPGQLFDRFLAYLRVSERSRKDERAGAGGPRSLDRGAK